MVIREKDSLYFLLLSKIKVNFTYTSYTYKHAIRIYTFLIQMSQLLRKRQIPMSVCNHRRQWQLEVKAEAEAEAESDAEKGGGKWSRSPDGTHWTDLLPQLQDEPNV